MEEPKFRHELKYSINRFDCLELLSRLPCIGKPDPNARPDGTYKVSSLYFDNVYDKAYFEKLNGVSNREKFRIRCYNDDPSYIRLEKKSKRSGLCQKESSLLSKEQCVDLLNGEFQFFRESGNPLFLELYAKMRTDQLRPKCIVEYTRRAFIFPAGNVRITIDSDIRSSSNVTRFLDPRLFCRGASGSIILEVKYDEFIPQVIIDIIQLRTRQSAAFSKYAGCRAIDF